MRLILLFCLLFPTFIYANTYDKKEKPKLDDKLVPLSDEAGTLDEVDEKLLKEYLFKKLLDEMDALSPEQRRKIFERQLQKEEALKKQKPLNLLTSILNVDTTPGSKPVKVYLSPGQDTYIQVIDGQGKPWPIVTASLGDDIDFVMAEVSKQVHHNKIRLGTHTRVGSTNLTLLLETLDTPVVVQIVASKVQYHAVAPLKLNQLGPNADPFISKTRSDYVELSESKELEQVILGKQPFPDSVELKSSNPLVKVWLKSNTMYVRSELDLRHPRAQDIYYGFSNWKAYKAQFLPALTFTNSDGDEEIVILEKH